MNNNQLTKIALDNIIKFWALSPWIKELSEIKWAKMSQRKAGCYLHLTKAIHLNPEILDKPGMEQAIEDTILHELIHVWQKNHPEEIIRREPHHGKGFRGQMYRINSILKREAVTIYHNYQMPANEKILRKAKAILARSLSGNEHESAVAAAKFAQYIQKYDLQLSHESLVLANELPELSDQVVAISNLADHWRRVILNELAYINACQLFWYHKIGYVEWHMIGREHRLDQIVFLYDYLESAMKRIVIAEQTNARRQKLSLGKAYWNAFRVGVAQNIAQRLRSDFENRMQEGINNQADENTSVAGGSIVSALVVQNWYKEETQTVKTYLEQQKYSLRSSKGCFLRSATGYDAGQKAGSGISLNRQIQKSSSSRLLTSTKKFLV